MRNALTKGSHEYINLEPVGIQRGDLPKTQVLMSMETILFTGINTVLAIIVACALWQEMM